MESASSAANSKTAEVLPVCPKGPLEIDVSGSVVSTIQDRLSGVESALPRAFIARTENVWLPSVSAV